MVTQQQVFVFLVFPNQTTHSKHRFVNVNSLYLHTSLYAHTVRCHIRVPLKAIHRCESKSSHLNIECIVHKLTTVSKCGQTPQNPIQMKRSSGNVNHLIPCGAFVVSFSRAHSTRSNHIMHESFGNGASSEKPMR